MDNNIIHAHGATHILQSEGHILDYVSVLNLNLDDIKLVTGDNVWRKSDMQRAISTLDSLIFGSGEMNGLSREVFTAEWVAVMILCFVKPMNWCLAAQSQSNLARSQDVVRSSELGITQVDYTITTRSLLAMLQMMLAQIDPKIFFDLQKNVISKIQGNSNKVVK